MEMQKFTGEEFHNGDGIDLHASDLPPTSEVPDWIKAATRDAMAAAASSRADRRHEPTPAERQAREIGAKSGLIVQFRTQEVELANGQQAA